MALKLFDTTSFPGHLNLHAKVQTLQMLPAEQSILASWVDGFVDRDGKFVTEFQSTFHSAFLELYIFAVLKAQGMSVDLSRPRPDFLVTAPQPIVIEAVTAGIRKDGRPEGERNLDDILSMFVPPWKNPDFSSAVIESVVRYSNAISQKALKYQTAYAALPWVSDHTPYVIAMGSFAQVNYGSEYHYSILALLYGRLFNASVREFELTAQVSKPGNGANIELNLFAKPEYRHVSAVLFTCTLTLGKLTSMAISEGHASMNMVRLLRNDNVAPFFKIQKVSPEHPEELFDGLFVLHNPNAANPLPYSTFADCSAIQVRAHGDGLSFEGGNLPLVARLNLSRCISTEDLLDLRAMAAAMEYNDEM